MPQDMNFPSRTALLVAVSIATLLPSDLAAQGRHPRYLHARSDLRRATRLMLIPDEPNVMRDMQAAADRVGRAIRELPHVLVYDNDDLRSPFRRVAVFEAGRMVWSSKPMPRWLEDLAKA